MKRHKIITVAAAAAAILLGQTTKSNAQNMENRILVAYFSATGTTENAARQIASATGGTLYEIQPAEKYTAADLNWNDRTSRSSLEMKDPKSRPTLKSTCADIAGYDTVYIGFPIWWYVAPRIINTFIESHDLAGKTIIPFATSGGSGISDAEKALQATYPNLNWEPGKLLNGMGPKDIGRWTEGRAGK